MNKIFLILLISILISSCRHKSIETARYELSEKELSLLPYQYGDSINFIHSNGYSFYFVVTEDILEWKKEYEFCEWFGTCRYSSYQVKSLVLKSNYPRMNLDISIGGTDEYYLLQTLNIDLNYDYNIQFPYDSLTNFICDSSTATIYYDSLLLNNKMYHNVYSGNIDRQRFINDSSIIVPQTMFINNFGIIQIKMSNNETYTINN